MIVKLLEIRDSATTIPAMAIQVSGEDGYLMRRAGFQSPMIYLIMLATQDCRYDPWGWTGRGRTMNIAHQWIAQHFATLTDGEVVDVQFIIGETKAPKPSEALTSPL